MKVVYSPPWWFIICEVIFSIAFIVCGAVTTYKQPCGTDEINFSLNTWILAAGIFGLGYALFVFIVMFVGITCICLICCMVPILYTALFGKVLLYIAWAIIGILFLAFNQQLVSECPVVYGFTIAAVVLLILDTIPTVRSTKIENSD